MITVHLPAPLRALAEGAAEVPVEGATVAEALRQLEQTHPRLAGWVLDERGVPRQHVSLFVNDAMARPEEALAPGDHLHIVPAISGGSASGVELLVGTRKGLFVIRGGEGGPLAIAGRRFAGQPVEYALRDPHSARYFASVTHGQFGPHLLSAPDPLAADGAWQEATGLLFPEDTGAKLERIWIVEPGARPEVMWAGVAPAALFRSDDGGHSWSLVRSLWDHPSRQQWQPGFGGLALHSICPWPGEPDRLAVGISAAGVWITEDGGGTWQRGGKGLVPRYVPEDVRATTFTLCVHKMLRAEREPTTLYMQFHGGVYRSDDAGLHWQDIGTATGLPSDFGFPLAIDPHDPRRAFVIPLVADTDRVTPEGRLRVYETTDRGVSWQPHGNGLPQENGYFTILRQAFAQDGRRPLGLYFGTESGDLFGSFDGGRQWQAVARGLPAILSVRAAVREVDAPA